MTILVPDTCLFNFSNPGSILKKLLHTGNSLKVFLFDDVFVFLFTLILTKRITLQFSISVFFRLLGFVILLIHLLIINVIIVNLDYFSICLQSFWCSNDLCNVTWKRYQYVLLNILFFSDLSSIKYTILNILISCLLRSYKSIFIFLNVVLKLKLYLVN